MMNKLKSYAFWKNRLIELTLAIMLGWTTIQIIQYREDQSRAEIEPTDWFEVFEVYVPDHPAGSNPNLVYDRVIREPFRGFWVAEVQQRDRLTDAASFNACTGSGVADYAPEDVLPDRTVSWEWFMGRPCNVAPGTYRIQITYDMRRDDYPTKRIVVFSNTFKVTP
jgi:hypothetical protein